ncbi:hypothetical protein ACH4JZ_27835 [Streptomyces sp. NPDC017615]|uniref:hypothetical protein n=1 Tax=Streptomyces sp. NPDC017615 TaxID=3365003 RepID=UPI003789BDCD
MSRYVRSSAAQAPTEPTGGGPGVRARIGSVLCGLVLTPGHLVTAYLVFLACVARPAGPWDSETVAHSNFAAGFALAGSVVLGLLTWGFVKAGWVRRWWYVAPVVLGVAALLRLTLLAPQL